MRKVLLISLLALLGLSSCIKVGVSTVQEDETTADFDFLWQEQDQPSDQVSVYMARTINSVHAVYGMHWDGDSWQDQETKSDSVRLYPGAYRAVAFAAAAEGLYSVTNENAFREQQEGLMELTAQLTATPSEAQEQDAMTLRLMSDSKGFPLIPEIDHAWIGIRQTELQKGDHVHLAFRMEDITQEITLSLKLENKSPQQIEISRVAVALLGIPSSISLLDRTAYAHYDSQGNIQGVGMSVIELSPSGKETSGDSEFLSYQGKIRALGMMGPVNDTDLSGYGVMKVCVLLSDGIGMIKPINLAGVLAQSPSMEVVADTKQRRLGPSVLLDLGRTAVLVLEKPAGDDGTAVLDWERQEEGGDIDIIPED